MNSNRDRDHLNILAILHYVLAALFGLFAFVPIIYIIIGILILNGQLESPNGDGPPAALGWVFIGFSCFGILFGLTVATFVAIAGRKLQTRSGHLFCLIIAGLECLYIPLGTTLGIFTIVVLLRPSVKALFGISSDPPGTPPMYHS